MPDVRKGKTHSYPQSSLKESKQLTLVQTYFISGSWQTSLSDSSTLSHQASDSFFKVIPQQPLPISWSRHLSGKLFSIPGPVSINRSENHIRQNSC